MDDRFRLSSDTKASRMKRVPSDALISARTVTLPPAGSPRLDAACFGSTLSNLSSEGDAASRSGSCRPERTVTWRKAARNNRGEMPSTWSSCITVVKRGSAGLVAGLLGPCAIGGLRNSTICAAMPRPHRLIAGQRSEETRQGGRGRRVQVDLAGLFFDRDRGAFAAGQTAA